MLEQYEQRHGESPKEIVAAPAALVALGATNALNTHLGEIPIKCFLFDEASVVPYGSRLGVFAKRISNNEIRLVSCDLK
jgi:hypothetical protein